MAVVIKDFLEGAFVDNCLILLDAWTVFAFVSTDCHRPELDALNGLPGILVQLQNFDAMETGVFESLQEPVFAERTRDATAPQMFIILHVFRNIFIANDIADHGTAANIKHTIDFGEQLLAGLVADKVQHAVGNHDVDAVRLDQ